MSLIEAATSLPALLAATRRAAEGKRKVQEVAEFLMDAEPHCLEIQRALRRAADDPEAWRPGPARSFVLRDPKPRRITVLSFSDRVVHHALMAPVAPAFERYAIFDTYACLPGRGQQRALWRALHFARGAPWVLKADIAAYFASVPHDRLLALLARRVPDPAWLALVGRVLAAHAPTPGRGLAIGSLVSQHAANLYLGLLDHHVKDTLGRPRYLRYMDDFLIFGGRDELRTLLVQLRTFLADSLDLQLNERHTAIRPVAHGFPFLGFRVRPDAIQVAPDRWARFRSRHRTTLAALACGRIEESTAAASLTAQYAHLAAFHTLALRRAWLSRLGEGGASNRREPGLSRGLLEERSHQGACRQPRQEHARQPQEQSWFASLQLNAPRGGLLRGCGADGAGSRIRALSPAVDQSSVLTVRAASDGEAPWPGGGPRVAAGPQAVGS